MKLRHHDLELRHHWDLIYYLDPSHHLKLRHHDLELRHHWDLRHHLDL